MNVVEALIAHHATLRQLYRQAEANPEHIWLGIIDHSHMGLIFFRSYRPKRR